MNPYTVRYQSKTGRTATFDVAALDEAAASREARKMLGCLADEGHTTITKAVPEVQSAGRARHSMDRITCPYCGYEDQDSWEFGGRQEEPLEVECGVCERAFIVTMYVEVTYTSIPKEVDR